MRKLERLWELFEEKADEALSILEEYLRTNLNFTGITFEDDDEVGEEIEGFVGAIYVSGWLTVNEKGEWKFTGAYKLEYVDSREEKICNFVLYIDIVAGKVDGPFLL